MVGMEKYVKKDDIELRVPPESEVLKQVAAEIPIEDIGSPEVQGLIDTMLELARGRQGDAKRRTMVGLAAPQIGVSKRLVIIGVDADGTGGKTPDLQAFINPVITEVSDETLTDREGCFSTGKVCGVLERPKWVRLQGYDRNGDPIERVLEGFPARIASHEVDHLDGIRFPDKITDDSKLHLVEPDQFGEYRAHWDEWTQLCPREEWLAIKGEK